jgi:hypothetical protein
MSCGRELFDKVIPIVLEAAKTAREDAGYGGRMDDGGASILEAQVKFFQHGLACRLPPEWEQYKKLLDPEYTEYLRLKRKFG